VPVGRAPLLACKPADIWKPAPLGLDERGQLVAVPLLWHSILVGGLPRQGKTFAAMAATATGHIGAGNAALVVVVLVVIWLVRVWLRPFGPCRRCRGSGRNIGSTGRRFGTCRKCGGSGRRQRPGSRTVHRAARWWRTARKSKG